jgi:hypothetical protein
VEHGCSFVDYDRHGNVDILVVRYVDFSYDSVPRPGQGRWCQGGTNVKCGPRGLQPGVSALYYNNSDGTFTDVSQKSGFLNTTQCYGFTSLTADFDHDGWPDIYVACDSNACILYHNNQNGTFTDIGKKAGVAYNEDGSEQAGMGLSADDFTHSGYEDLVKTNFSDDTPTLYLIVATTILMMLPTVPGLAGSGTAWVGECNSMTLILAGWPGILIANGHVYPEVDGKALGTSYREPKAAYDKLHDGTFANITADAGVALSEPHSGRGMALADLFNEGHQEALVNNMNERPSLYYNSAPAGNWISLKLVGVKSNRAALGAGVTLEQGSDKHEREVRSGDGDISQGDLRLHFGLGKSSRAEKIVIRWPSGLIETLSDLPANQYYVVHEGSGVDQSKVHGVSSVRINVPGTNTQ